MKKYSSGINGLRGICALIIVLFHFELYYSFGKIKIFSAGYIAVEFFFILSGFLIYKSFNEKNKDNIANAVSGKIKKMYPAYLIALIMLISVYVIKWYGFNYLNWIKQEPNNFNFISELFMVQTTGVTNFNYINGPAWYVSSLVINTIFIMGILKIFKKFSKHIFLVLSLSIYTYFYINDFSMSPNYLIFGFVSSALLRGLAGMSLGCFIYYITDKFSSSISKMNDKVYNIIQIALFALFMGLLLFRTPSRLNYLIFIPSTLLISLMFCKEGIIDRILSCKLFKYLGIISFEIYIFQSPCSNIINCWFSNMKQPFVTIFYLFLNLMIAAIFYCCSCKISKLRRNKNEI